MARGDNLRQSELMIRAEESGQQARARAHENLMAEGKYTSESFQRMGQQAGQNIQQHEEFKESQYRTDRSDFRAGQQIALEAAKSGFDMPQDQGPQRGETPRAKQLREDMERGASQTAQQGQGGMIGPLETEQQENLRRQGQKPLESTPNGFRQNEYGKRVQEVKESEAITERIRAEAYADQVGIQAQEAAAKGDMDEYKAKVDISAKHVNGLVSKFDKLMGAASGTGKEEFSNEDWADISKMAGEGEMNDPKLMEAIATKDASNPRLQQFLRAQISIESIKHIFRTGDASSIKVDWTTPKMREFKQSVDYFNDLAQGMGPGFAKFAGINSIESKMRFLNQQAAMAVMMGMTGQQASQRFDKSGEKFITGEEEKAMRASGDEFAGFDEGAPQPEEMPNRSSPKGQPQEAPQEAPKLRRFDKPGSRTLIQGGGPKVNRPAFEPRRGSEYEL